MKSQRLVNGFLVFVCLALAAPLVGYAVVGTTARYRADDFCHSADIFTEGFWKAQAVVYMTTSDRYAVEPLVGISELFGRSAIRLLPALVIALWLAGMVWTLRQGAKAAKLPLRWPVIILLAELLVFFTLLEAPSRFQSLYWRAGMLTYLCPLVANTMLSGYLLKHLAKPPRLAYLGAVLMAFYAGGFSETSAALQTGAYALALLAALPWMKGALNKPALTLLASALAGSLLALLALYLSPAAHLRQANFAAPPDLLTLAAFSLSYGLDFMVDTFKVVPLPSLVSFGMASLLSFYILVAPSHVIASPEGAKQFGDGVRLLSPSGVLRDRFARNDIVRLFLKLVAALLAGYLLIVCTMAPSMYAYQAYPEPRALITSRFVMVALMVWMGWLAGEALFWLDNRLQISHFTYGLGTLLLLAFLSLYPLRAALQTRQEYAEYQARAIAWDERDRAIQAAIANGEQQLTVVALDSIGAIGDLSPDPQHWANECAARFYGVRSIVAYLP